MDRHSSGLSLGSAACSSRAELAPRDTRVALCAGTLYGRSTFELDRVAIYGIARPQGGSLAADPRHRTRAPQGMGAGFTAHVHSIRFAVAGGTCFAGVPVLQQALVGAARLHRDAMDFSSSVRGYAPFLDQRAPQQRAPGRHGTAGGAAAAGNLYRLYAAFEAR